MSLRIQKKIQYLYAIKFKLEAEIKCAKPQCYSNSNEFLFCHNDNKYFCKPCDEEFHKSYKILQNHKRTAAVTYSINFQGNCVEKGHDLKPYEFYCPQCRYCYCIKDIHEGLHKYEDHQIRYIDDLYDNFDQELKGLQEKIKILKKGIDFEMDEREKNAKEIQEVYTSSLQKIEERQKEDYDRLNKEIIHRCTYLASISLELQRLNSEIESKIAFLRNQYNNTDHATFIALTSVFSNYMKIEVMHNIDILMGINYEGISNKLFDTNGSQN